METQVLRGSTCWFQMKPFVLLAHLSTLEPRLPVALAGVDGFGEAVKRVSRFNNIFTCDWSEEVAPGPKAQGAFGQRLC